MAQGNIQQLTSRSQAGDTLASLVLAYPACGIILAGTFATLMTSPMRVVFQIGAAVVIGVIIDTFLVRALLVPALAVLAGRWSWWPSSLFRRKSAVSTPENLPAHEIQTD